MRCLRCAERRCMCGQVLWVMHEARCAADVAHGRECCEWKKGTQREEGEAKERAVEEGLKYAKRDAAAYEKRCALEPAEAAERAAKTARRAEGAARVAAREAERLRVEEAGRVAAIPGRIARGELVVERYVEVSGGVNPVLWAVDVASDARQFREAGIGCVEHEGMLYVEAKNTNTWHDAGTRVVAKAEEVRLVGVRAETRMWGGTLAAMMAEPTRDAARVAAIADQSFSKVDEVREVRQKKIEDKLCGI